MPSPNAALENRHKENLLAGLSLDIGIIDWELSLTQCCKNWCRVQKEGLPCSMSATISKMKRLK